MVDKRQRMAGAAAAVATGIEQPRAQGGFAGLPGAFARIEAARG